MLTLFHSHMLPGEIFFYHIVILYLDVSLLFKEKKQRGLVNLMYRNDA